MKEEMTISEGDFSSFGTKSVNNETIFTFLCEGEKVSLNLYEIKTKNLVKSFDISREYFRGKVCSFSVSGIDQKKHCYRYEIDGKEVLDEYASFIIGRDNWGESDTSLFCGFSHSKLKPSKFDMPPENELIIYKLHMRGITMDKAIGKTLKGNYKGLIGHIPKLKELGINCVEILPIYDFNESFSDGRINYWGYGDSAPFYFAPKASYFGGIDAGENAIKLVNAFHEAGIAVILEFCFNAASDEFVVDVVKHWAFNYGIDGFRFIGTTIPKEKLYRDPFISDKYLFFEDFPLDIIPRSSKTKKRIFIENDSFIYPIRRLQNHMDGSANDFCNTIKRQDDYFGYINYVAAKNGFTLYDSYSYCDKHNEDNGEENKDGSNYNCTINNGIEGQTRDKNVTLKRLTGVRTALATLMFSQGIPLICSGDEMLNSANGNNNPYCQDNKIGWVNYSRRKDAILMREYFIKLVEFRKNHPILSNKAPYRMNDYKRIGLPDVSFHGREPWIVEVDECHKSIGILYTGFYGENTENSTDNEDIMFLFNFYNSCEKFALPDIAGKKWYFISNTGSFEWNENGILIDNTGNYLVKSGTLTILVAK